MFRILARRLHRDRVRITITFACFALISLIWNIADPNKPLHLGMLAFVAVGTGLALSLMFGFFSVLIPRWRVLVELSGIFCLLNVLQRQLAPGLVEIIPASWQMPAMILLCVGVANLYLSHFLDRFMLRGGFSFSATAHSPLPVDQIWDGLFALPENRAALYNADSVLEYEVCMEAPLTLRIIERTSDVEQIEELQHIELRDPPYTLRFRWEVPTAPADTPYARGTFSATMESLKGGGTRITTTHAPDLYSARMAFFARIDDHFGRQLDEKLAVLEKRARLPSADPLPT